MTAVWLSLNELDRMAHQLHQAIVVGEFSLPVCDIPGKGRVQLDMPCDVDGSLHVSVVIPVADISLEEPFVLC